MSQEHIQANDTSHDQGETLTVEVSEAITVTEGEIITTEECKSRITTAGGEIKAQAHDTVTQLTTDGENVATQICNNVTKSAEISNAVTQSTTDAGNARDKICSTATKSAEICTKSATEVGNVKAKLCNDTTKSTETGNVIKSTEGGKVKEKTCQDATPLAEISYVTKSTTEVVNATAEGPHHTTKSEEIHNTVTKSANERENVTAKISHNATESVSKGQTITTEDSKNKLATGAAIESKELNHKIDAGTKSTEGSSKVHFEIGGEEETKGCCKSGSSKSEFSSKSSESTKSTSKASSSKRVQGNVTVTTEKDQALYAHNVIRKLHGVYELEWDQNLANEAKVWAKKLANKHLKLIHQEPVIGYGQNLYKAKGSSSPAKPYQAVMLWYKSIQHYKFNLPGYSSSTACATQLLWSETTHVGMAVAFREDTQTTYIVARYSPPGNDRFSESYIEHVKQPLKGLPPKMPKIEDLISQDPNENLSNMGSLFDVLCHWCACDGEKPIEEISGVQPTQDDSSAKNKPIFSTGCAANKDEGTKCEEGKNGTH